MRDGMVAALVIVLVIASSGASYFVGNSNRQTVTATSTSLTTATTTTSLTTTLTKTVAPNETCDHATSPPTHTLNAVLLIPPDSTGFVCVTYDAGMPYVQQFQQELWNGGTIYLLGSHGTVSKSTGINLTAISASLTQNNETIEYQMRTSGNSTGAYTWWAPGTCPGLPLIVASNVTGYESSLKQYYNGSFYCPELFFGAWLNGGTGISFVNLSS
jgi:hypothetical protein